MATRTSFSAGGTIAKSPKSDRIRNKISMPPPEKRAVGRPSGNNGSRPVKPPVSNLAGPNLHREPDGGHRASCHRCGNLRKKNVKCVSCPHIYCQRCAEKMVVEFGKDIFAGGCPVCKGICCCNDARDATYCGRLFHCYKKCPATKNAGGTGGGDLMSTDTDKVPVVDASTASAVVNNILDNATHSRMKPAPSLSSTSNVGLAPRRYDLGSSSSSVDSGSSGGPGDVSMQNPYERKHQNQHGRDPNKRSRMVTPSALTASGDSGDSEKASSAAKRQRRQADIDMDALEGVKTEGERPDNSGEQHPYMDIQWAQPMQDSAMPWDTRPQLSTNAFASMTNMPQAYASPNIQFVMRQYGVVYPTSARDMRGQDGSGGQAAGYGDMASLGGPSYAPLPLPLPVASPSPMPNLMNIGFAPGDGRAVGGLPGGPTDLRPMRVDGSDGMGLDPKPQGLMLTNAFPHPSPLGATPGAYHMHMGGLNPLGTSGLPSTGMPLMSQGYQFSTGVGPGLLTQMMNNDAFSVNMPAMDINDKGTVSQRPGAMSQPAISAETQEAPTAATATFRRAGGGSDSLSSAPELPTEAFRKGFVPDSQHMNRILA